MTDDEALAAALQTYAQRHAEDPRRWPTLADRPAHDRGPAAVYRLQVDRLGLRPWEVPPMFASTVPADNPAAILAARMDAAGVSRLAPDPLASLEAAEAAQ